MREIKFRAWDKEYKHFHEGDLVREYVLGEFVDNPEYEVMQYTGLKDKNGVEIYEGDILKLTDFDKGEVDFYKGSWRVKTSKKYADDEWRTSLWDAVIDEFEIIGNIYENPNLLGGDE